MNNKAEQEMENLEKSIQSLKSIEVELTPGARFNLARLCAQETVSSRLRFWAGVGRFFAFQVPQRATAMALGMVLLLGLTSVLVSHKAVSPVVGPSPESRIKQVSINPDASGRMTLVWEDGSRSLYRVLKSDNPRDFSNAVSYSVRGNRWTDRNPGVGQVTFYRVE